jgi:hypothetical protein
MATAMLEKFDKYWEEKNNVMVIATILDPRFKMRYFTWCFEELYSPYRCMKETEEINKELEQLYEKYSKLVSRDKDNAPSTSHSRDTTSSLASVVPSGFQSFLQSSASVVSKSELLIYLEEKNVDVNEKSFDLMNYWKVNDHATRFPILAAMAKSFLHWLYQLVVYLQSLTFLQEEEFFNFKV